MEQHLTNISDIYYKTKDGEYRFASSKNISFAMAVKNRTKVVFDDGKVIYSNRSLIVLISQFYGNGYFFINKRLWLKPVNIISFIQEDSTSLLVMKNQVSIELQQKDVEELLNLLRMKKVSIQ